MFNDYPAGKFIVVTSDNDGRITKHFGEIEGNVAEIAIKFLEECDAQMIFMLGTSCKAVLGKKRILTLKEKKEETKNKLSKGSRVEKK